MSEEKEILDFVKDVLITSRFLPADWDRWAGRKFDEAYKIYKVLLTAKELYTRDESKLIEILCETAYRILSVSDTEQTIIDEEMTAKDIKYIRNVGRRERKEAHEKFLDSLSENDWKHINSLFEGTEEDEPF